MAGRRIDFSIAVEKLDTYEASRESDYEDDENIQ